MNRVSAFTRWPADPQKRLMLAQLDLDFLRALDRCGIPEKSHKSLKRIADEALRQGDAAIYEIEGR